MAETVEPRPPSFSGLKRFLLLVLAAGLCGALALAAALSPDRRGHGTHEQLGLPPCTFVVLFGRHCPSCGMTTAWACLTRGHVIEAFRANACGALLGLIAAAGVPWLLASAALGRWAGWSPSGNVAAWLVVGLVVIALVQWGWRLSAG